MMPDFDDLATCIIEVYYYGQNQLYLYLQGVKYAFVRCMILCLADKKYCFHIFASNINIGACEGSYWVFRETRLKYPAASKTLHYTALLANTKSA